MFPPIYILQKCMKLHTSDKENEKKQQNRNILFLNDINMWYVWTKLAVEGKINQQ